MAITRFKVIQGHHFRYQSKVRMRLTTSELENVTIANALQLEAARRYPVLSRFITTPTPCQV